MSAEDDLRTALASSGVLTFPLSINADEPTESVVRVSDLSVYLESVRAEALEKEADRLERQNISMRDDVDEYMPGIARAIEELRDHALYIRINSCPHERVHTVNTFDVQGSVCLDCGSLMALNEEEVEYGDSPADV